MMDAIKEFFNKIVNNPLMLIGFVLGAVLLVVLIFGIVVIVKKTSSKEYKKKKEERVKLKQDELAREEYKRNIDVEIFKRMNIEKKARALSEDEEIDRQEYVENIVENMDKSIDKNRLNKNKRSVKSSQKLYKEKASSKRLKKKSTENVISVMQGMNIRKNIEDK